MFGWFPSLYAPFSRIVSVLCIAWKLAFVHLSNCPSAILSVRSEPSCSFGALFNLIAKAMSAKSLSASKYATRTAAEGVAISRSERLKQGKERATRLLIRLKWKADSLASSYARAVEILNSEQPADERPVAQQGYSFTFFQGMSSKQAESMFKVDFFEFYTLLERYLTVCLALFGIFVSGNAPRSNLIGLRLLTDPDYAKRKLQADHQFHANLLDALTDTKNPLCPALGHQDIQMQLALAKDYRNRWKDADEKLLSSQWQNVHGEETLGIRLKDLGLGVMVRTILSGCEHALDIVLNQTSNYSFVGSTLSQVGSEECSLQEAMDMDDMPFEFMDDAMELD
ncbi:uncharacterized protein EI97DRAFT_232763 [Westerdykella ornata]|uniref:Uncharacterized protein n=1 Tax=Westerdykella ornata TaxID=318751 RepID=A0A6A6J8B5_WESOR|nr:uncharacterized protein EI97DRAFT_232763 [Westerdykella ornata]KAF2272248.1 hypothetical protein EI97DRAFT_232763 [Westerdykella ornata]